MSEADKTSETEKNSESQGSEDQLSDIQQAQDAVDQVENAENVSGEEAQDSNDVGDTEATPDEIEAAKAEADKFRDIALRAEAEMQNIKRRAERDVENAHKFGVERFLQNLIPVVDSIEKAVEASDAANVAEDDPVFEGVKLCRKLLLDVLARENVEVIDPEGEPFDPNLHEALSMVDNPDVEPNTVVLVVQRGYQLNGRLVRPAMVMVSKTPA